jgi:hypothetical protein
MTAADGPRIGLLRLRVGLSLLACLAVYLVLALPQLDLPGLHNDEAAEGGLPAMQILAGQPVTAFRDTGLAVAGRLWPLMVQDYIGALNVYLALPFLALGGPTTAALRLYAVAVGALTVACAFGFMAQAFSLRAALLAGLLLAVSPSFVFWQRQGIYVTSITATLAVAVLWLGAAWVRRGGWAWALALGLACGLGIYAKLLFIWVFNGLLGALLLINLPALARVIGFRLRRQPSPAGFRPPSSVTRHSPPVPRPLSSVLRPLFPRTPSLAEILAAAAGLLLGLAPLLLYNLQTGGTVLSIGSNLDTSYYGVDNADVLGNLRVRLIHFRSVLEGRDHLWYLGGSFSNPAWPWALALAALVIAVAVWRRRPQARRALALALLLGLGVLQTAFTVSGLFPTHFAIFSPLAPMIVAAALELGLAASGPWRRGRVLAVILLLAWAGLAGRDTANTLSYHQALARSGGEGPHTDAVYRLKDYLLAQGGEPMAALDWGFGPQIDMLTGGRVVPAEVFGYDWEPDPGFAARVTAVVESAPSVLVIFHVPQETIIPRRAAFDALAQQQGWRVEPVAAIARRDGAPVFDVLRVSR